MKGKVRVLVIDDSAMVREILSRGLSLDPDIEVIGTASYPYIARDKIVELIPVVIVQHMPEMDGEDLLRYLKNSKRFYKIHVIVISSKTNNFNEAQLLKDGATAVSNKPITPILLADIIEPLDINKRG